MSLFKGIEKRRGEITLCCSVGDINGNHSSFRRWVRIAWQVCQIHSPVETIEFTLNLVVIFHSYLDNALNNTFIKIEKQNILNNLTLAR